MTTGLIAAVLGDLAGNTAAAVSILLRLTPLRGVGGIDFSRPLRVRGVSGFTLDFRLTAVFLLAGVGADNFSNISIFSLSS